MKQCESLKEELQRCESVGAELRLELKELKTQRKQLENDLAESRKKVHGLQMDLDNSEAVQRDFVRLSQSLQVELEKIRQAENEVRWQHEDDVLLCNACKQPFNKIRRKQHCWHCGKIYCFTCINKAVVSGPAQRPAPVCDVCHTILVRDTAPYFSTQAPEPL